MKEAFHQRLQRLRATRGWSLTQLAKKSEVQEKLIHKLETDPREVPSWSAISRLASALGTNPIYLATGDGDAKPFHVPRVGLARGTYYTHL